MNWEEACHVLGIPPTASEEEVREQYLYKVQLLHPDWNQDKPLMVRQRAEEELKRVNEAYDVLKDSTNGASAPKLDITLKRIRFRSLDLGQKKSATFEVRSAGGAYTKVWIEDSPAPWLKVTDIKSLTSELLPLEVTIEATGVGEPDRHYACNLKIRLENEVTEARDEAIIKAELRMKAEPGVLKVEAKNAIKFRSVQPGAWKSRSLKLSNTGRGRLQGHLSSTRSWLTVSPDSLAIPPSAGATHTVTVTATDLRPGLVDRAFINIITNGGNDRIPVQLSTARFPRRRLYGAIVYVVLILACLAALAASARWLG